MRILLITTGGTIAGEVSADKQENEIKRTAEEFSNLLDPTLNFLSRKYGFSIELDIHTLCSVDSSDILPQHWKDLVNLIKDKYDEFDSFVITHGTNTLGYTCSALSFAFANPNKPIILTGSQVPAGLPGSDGQINLENALRVAVWRRDDRAPIKGVMAVFGSHIISGTRVEKDTDFDYDAFKPFNTGSIGRIGRIIDINDTNLLKHLDYLKTNRFPLAKRACDLRYDNDFDMRIASLTEFPGMSSKIFETLVENNDIRGFIFRTFGAGDPSQHHRVAFEYLKSKEIPIVVTTQATNGNSNLQVNDPGKMLKDNALAIPAYDMSVEAQTTKLAWLMAKKNKGELTYMQLCEEMTNDIRGEVNVMWEIGE